VKEFLSQRGIAYVDRDIAKDPQALADLEQLGYFTTPVTTIEGHVVVGFDKPALDRLLAGSP